MDGKTKTTSKIRLVTDFISVRVTSPILATRDPNLNRISELKPIPNPLLIFFEEGIRDVSSFIRSGTGGNLGNHTIIRRGQPPVSNSLDLTSLNIFSDLATLAEWETRGNKEERTKLCGQSPPPPHEEIDPLETLSLYSLKQTT